jgi:hypothetical protein
VSCNDYIWKAELVGHLAEEAPLPNVNIYKESIYLAEEAPLPNVDGGGAAMDAGVDAEVDAVDVRGLHAARQRCN